MARILRMTITELKHEHRRALAVAHRRIEGHDRGSSILSPVGVDLGDAARYLERAAAVRRELVTRMGQRVRSPYNLTDAWTILRFGRDYAPETVRIARQTVEAHLDDERGLS